MTRLPICDSRKMERFLFSLCFAAVRSKGGHTFYRHSDGRTTTLPHHAGRDLARPLIRLVLREIDVTPDAYLEWLGTNRK